MFYCFMCTMKPLGNYIGVSWLSINNQEVYSMQKQKGTKETEMMMLERHTVFPHIVSSLEQFPLLE